MRDLFGEPERWSQTLRSLLWTHASVVVPSFQGARLVDLPVPCTFDFNVAATKYLRRLDGRGDTASSHVQRHCFLCGRRMASPGGADLMGAGSQPSSFQ